MTILAQRIAEALDARALLAECHGERTSKFVPDVTKVIEGVLRNNALDIVSDLNAQGFVLLTETGGDVTVDEAAEALIDAMKMEGDSDE